MRPKCFLVAFSEGATGRRFCSNPAKTVQSEYGWLETYRRSLFIQGILGQDFTHDKSRTALNPFEDLCDVEPNDPVD